MCDQRLVFIGIIVSPTSIKELSITRGFLSVDNGRISHRGSIKEYEELKKKKMLDKYQHIELTADQFIMPGLVDCHTHAPQFPNLGLGLDRPLLEWLDKYTFPLENQYGDMEFASHVYNQVVQRLLKNGTTTACYFGTIHLDGTKELAKSIIKYGQRGLVGKVSMNIENDAGYYTETEKELRDVEAFVQDIFEMQDDLIAPVITPRFAVSCDEKLMTGLANIAKKYGIRTQSHISENHAEIEHVLKINPGCHSYAHVYDRSSILSNMCIMAHAVHLKDDEITLFAAKGVSVAHCPASNTRLMSGLCPVRKLLDNNIIVGLGTDVSGGDSQSILDAMRRTMDVAAHLAMLGEAPPCSAITWREAFYLATLGGARALSMDDRIGSLEIGKDFDALIIDAYAKNSPIDRYEHLVKFSEEEEACNLVQRFVYSGGDENIVQVYVKGRKVKEVVDNLTH